MKDDKLLEKIEKKLPKWASVCDVEMTNNYYGQTAIVLTLKKMDRVRELLKSLSDNCLKDYDLFFEDNYGVDLELFRKEFNITENKPIMGIVIRDRRIDMLFFDILHPNPLYTKSLVVTKEEWESYKKKEESEKE